MDIDAFQIFMVSNVAEEQKNREKKIQKRCFSNSKLLRNCFATLMLLQQVLTLSTLFEWRRLTELIVLMKKLATLFSSANAIDGLSLT